MPQAVVKPIRIDADGNVEVFEAYSAKLGKTIQITPRSGKEALLSDRGLVMISPAPGERAAPV